MNGKLDWKPRSKAAQALGWVEPHSNGLIPAIHPATTYLRNPGPQAPGAYSYTRNDNPNYRQAEALLAELECGRSALLFSSGMAAASAVFQALTQGAHVLAPKVMYWVLRQWLLEIGEPSGLDVEFYANDDIDALARAIRPGKTRLVWLETPANPTWAVTDIAAAVEIAHHAGAIACVDNTVATPVLTRPLQLGADLVMHSATKYLNGHSDVLAGALISARDNDLWRTIGRLRTMNGAVPGPFESWLLLRGMRTLYVRMAQACANADIIARHLRSHEGIMQVLYPGLEDHPGFAVSSRQMDGGFGAMLSIRVRGNAADAIAVSEKTQLWKRATSLGGVESLIEHRASIEGPNSPVSDDLLRLSVGIEDPNDLIADLARALNSV